jgi:hypothetical protein
LRIRDSVMILQKTEAAAYCSLHPDTGHINLE